MTILPVIRGFTAASLLATVVIAAPSVAATVGNPAVRAANLDSAAPLTFIIDQSFGATPGVLTSFNFFAGRAGDITPLLFSRGTAPGLITFTLLGVGTTRSVGAAGAYTFDFGLAQGVSLTDANSFFGFRTGGQTVVTYDYQSNTLPGTFAKGQNRDGVGSMLAFDPNARASDTGNGLNFRGYSINATTTPVPEPATWGMMLLGFGGMGYAMRRRAKVTTRIRFA